MVWSGTRSLNIRVRHRHRLCGLRLRSLPRFHSTLLSFCIVLDGAGAVGRALQVVEFQRGRGLNAVISFPFGGNSQTLPVFPSQN